ncbi:hypothetical protein TraAM80_05332 [Trypanosoma rangeli]|uniref:Uncharacterized protein n=1 Tax=Trypanosoma rangeli TaxID=5698 RepID=A0A3R7MKA9_TRYRA|nr:uncharacterized protein TraAM80_05332 [Trypanosoma rangeli]RNF04055.1 hypothetical protein TraAM80_05332 [Trypanosoma rangeli]|eukprot:RNF04055.1 hypothetical protein TraAM80_05332 [Trypanosoma rangeli]
MPVVDVDIVTIPDMIEAQLTLSYSRLTHLVRLIVDQGNGHDVDIDKMSSRIDALTRENEELRVLVGTLVDKSHESWVRKELENLREEVAHVSNACAESSKKLASVTEEFQWCFDEMEKRLKVEAATRTSDMDQIHLSVSEVRDVVRDMGDTLKHLRNFVDVWESKPETTESLTTRDAAGALQHPTEERVGYLSSLPVFTKVFDEMDVLRQMLQQQAADSLSAKNVAGAIRRLSAAEIAASGGSDSNKVDRDTINGLRESLGSVLQRLNKLESRPPPAFGQAQLQQQQPPATPSVELEDIIKFEKRLQHVENGLRSLSFQLSDGGGLDKAHLTGSDGRLRSPESGGETLSLQRLPRREGEIPMPDTSGQQFFRPQSQSQSQSQRPASASLGRRAPAPGGREGNPDLTGDGLALPYLTTLPSNGRNEPSYPQAPQKARAGAPSSGEFTVQPLELAAGDALAVTPFQVSTQAQAMGYDDEIQRRIARLEEGSTALERKKADRQELAQLGDVLQQLLENPALLQVYPHLQALIPRRPMSQQESRGTHFMESAYCANSATVPGSAMPGRPVFIGGKAHTLRDNTGAMTSATLSTSHLV